MDPQTHRVISLPDVESSVLTSPHYAGHINIGRESDSNVFYWFFEAETNKESQPLLIWLNGGPGCSSMDGLFIEIGPLKMVNDRIQGNPHSWHKHANLLFVDQPVGTGFSYTGKHKYASSNEEVADQFYTFLVEFLELHSSLLSSDGSARHSRAIHFSGESHAGVFIPYIVSNILDKNREISSNGVHMNIAGIALGNPWLDPFVQYDVSDFAYAQGILNKGQLNRMKEKERTCQSLLRQNILNRRECLSLLDEVVDSSTLRGKHKVLMYDSRRFVSVTSVFPPNHESVERYLNRPDVKTALHASQCPHSFAECTDPPFNALSHLEGTGATNQLIQILNSGIQVLIYAGVNDIICNHIGVEKALRRLEWNGRAQWLESGPLVWTLGQRPVGYLTSGRNLHLLKVLDSGHMVPLDQPVVAAEMIHWLLTKTDGALLVGGTTIGVSAQDGCLPETSAKQLPVPPQQVQVFHQEAEVMLTVAATAAAQVMSLIPPDLCKEADSLRKLCVAYLTIRHPTVPNHIPSALMTSILTLDLNNVLSFIESSKQINLSVMKQLYTNVWEVKVWGSRTAVLDCVSSLEKQWSEESSRLSQGVLTRNSHLTAILTESSLKETKAPPLLSLFGDDKSIDKPHGIIIIIIGSVAVFLACMIWRRTLMRTLYSVFSSIARRLEIRLDSFRRPETSK